MGEYDGVFTVEAPSDEVTIAFAMGLSFRGNVRTKTLKAFTIEQLPEMVKGLP